MSIQSVMDRGDFLRWAEGWFQKEDLGMTDLGGFLDWRVEACFDARKESRKVLAEKSASLSPSIGLTGCLICGQFTDHGGLQCPKMRATCNGTN